MKRRSIGDILPDIGFAYVARTGHPELSSHERPSSARVMEDGAPLPGPPNSLHDDIRNQGAGRYSFWHDALYFSASDNSDPRTNGRVYAIVYGRTFWRLIIPLMRCMLRFCERWVGRGIRFSRRVRLVPMFWGSIYWTCFGWLLVRGWIKGEIRRLHR